MRLPFFFDFFAAVDEGSAMVMRVGEQNEVLGKQPQGNACFLKVICTNYYYYNPAYSIGDPRSAQHWVLGATRSQHLIRSAIAIIFNIQQE